jgi:hypothetical protein
VTTKYAKIHTRTKTKTYSYYAVLRLNSDILLLCSTPTTPSGPSVVSLQPAYFTGSDIRVRDDEMQLAHIATAWETVELTHADSPATMVMQVERPGNACTEAWKGV